MSKFEIPWGVPSKVVPLSEAEIEELKSKVTSNAKATSAFSMHLSYSELLWLKKNLTNGVVEILVNFADNHKPFFVAIGTDVFAITKLKDSMRL